MPNPVIVGTQPGDNYSTVASAIAAMPDDLVAYGGNYVIQVRADGPQDGQWYQENRIVMPSPSVADANHRPILQAFPGDEADGFGNGAGLKHTRGYREILRLGNWWIVENLHVENYDALGYGLDLEHAQNFIVRNCWLSGGNGSLFLANGSTPSGAIENIIISGQDNSGTPQSRRTLNLNGIDGNVTLDRLTVVDSNTDGIEGSAFSTGAADFTNCLVLGSAGSDYDNRVGTESVSDYLASSDTTAANEAATTHFILESTDDLEDYANGNFNLKSTSNLKGVGSNGSDVGATLPATQGPSLTPVSRTFSFDATIRSLTSKTQNLDTSLRSQVAKTYAIDSTLRSQVAKTYPIDTSLRSPVTKTYSLTTSLNGALTPVSRTVSLDATLRTQVSRTQGLDANLREAISKTASLSASLRTPTSRTISLDTKLRTQVSRTQGLDANLRAAVFSTSSLSAQLTGRVSAIYSLDARLETLVDWDAPAYTLTLTFSPSETALDLDFETPRLTL